MSFSFQLNGAEVCNFDTRWRRAVGLRDGQPAGWLGLGDLRRYKYLSSPHVVSLG